MSGVGYAMKRRLKRMQKKREQQQNEDQEEEVTQTLEAQKPRKSKKRKAIDAQSDPDEMPGEAPEQDDAKPETSSVPLSIISEKSFSLLQDEVSAATLRAIKAMQFTHMTEIQAKTIPALLQGRDLMGAAKTGSGKTLAFLIPAIELLYKLKFLPRNGTGCLIISPTRELSLQTYGVLTELAQFHNLTHGLIMGGANRQAEAEKLAKGVNILVATPGRLLDHMQNTKQFMFKNLKCLVIDEADRILQVGFEQEMQQIVKLLPKILEERQTMLFSATQSQKTEHLARLALKKEPMYVGVHDNREIATVEGLQQGYVVCPSDKRFLLLFTFLKKNRNKKVMVFFSSCNSVKFHNELFNYIDLPVICIHGNQKQTKRTTTFFSFSEAKQGILLCTDVAARGLDIPKVDWIVQYDPPDDPKEYIHRVGRTARGEGGVGHALLYLRPEELGFLRYLKHAKVPLNEYEFSWSKVSNIQLQLEKLIEQNYYLNKSAKEAYKACIRSYDSHHLKDIFDITALDLKGVAKSFGFSVPPFVELPITNKARIQKRAGTAAGYQRNDKSGFKKKIFKQAGNKRFKSDNRQFTR